MLKWLYVCNYAQATQIISGCVSLITAYSAYVGRHKQKQNRSNRDGIQFVAAVDVPDVFVRASTLYSFYGHSTQTFRKFCGGRRQREKFRGDFGRQMRGGKLCFNGVTS